MTNERFDQILQEEILHCLDVLNGKATEYAADSDRLHNFQVAAALTGETWEQALAGMMKKHTVSIYDMCYSGRNYPLELWREKITDHINYLLLLWAMRND